MCSFYSVSFFFFFYLFAPLIAFLFKNKHLTVNWKLFVYVYNTHNIKGINDISRVLETQSYSFHASNASCALLTCHCEHPHHPVYAPVSQQSHVHSSGCTFLLFPFGLKRSPDAGTKDQEVENHHCYHSWDVDGHGGLVDWLPHWRMSECLSNRPAEYL